MFSSTYPKTMITHFLDMPLEAITAFWGLSRKTVKGASAGKFMHVESCYSESFGLLCLSLADLKIMRVLPQPWLCSVIVYLMMINAEQ